MHRINEFDVKTIVHKKVYFGGVVLEWTLPRALEWLAPALSAID